ncbi:MAG: universal stress protein [Aestuariivirgaceae bacterium]
MKTILVPTDGSVAADKALGIALDLARLHGAQIKLLHVLLHDKEPDELLRLPEIGANEEVVAALKATAAGPAVTRTAEEVMAAPNAPDRPAADDVLTMIGAHVLGRAVARARAGGVAVDALDVADGATAATIISAAEAEAADTIVMGMRGLRQIEALTYGSVSQEVCRTAKCTCIAVH